MSGGESERSRQGEGRAGSAMQRRRGSGLARRGWLSGGPLVTPWDLMRRATDEMERMLDAMDATRMPFFAPAAAAAVSGSLHGAGTAEWMPQVEMVQNENSVTVRVDLPGMDADDIDVSTEDNMLIVSGERSQEEREEKEGFVRTERRYGRFYRAIPLPESADESQIEASFDRGVLEVSVPLSGRQHGRRISVSSGERGTPGSRQSAGTQGSQSSQSQSSQSSRSQQR